MTTNGIARPASNGRQEPDDHAVQLLLAMSAESTGELAEDLRRGLELAADFFGLEFGIVSRVEGDRYVVEHVHQPEGAGLEPGQEFTLGDTYCAITLEASDVVSIDEMRSSKFSGHPCYDMFHLESYLGVPLHIDGEVFGTLNFSSPNVRTGVWTETDRQLVRMLARWVESSISQDRLRGILARTLNDLDHANRELVARNEDLDSFARHASHDLQAPLKNVVALMRLLVDDLGEQLPARATEDMALIEQEIDRMHGIVQALLTFSRSGREEIENEPVALDDCVDAALEALRASVEDADAEIVRSPLPTVRGARPLLTLVFQNLIGNAVKFRRDGTRPRVEISGQRRGDIAQVRVDDNGIGIDPKHAESIFAPLTRLHGPGEFDGNGLGLAIVRKIVSRHGGVVDVESTPGEGSTFTLTLEPAGADAIAS